MQACSFVCPSQTYDIAQTIAIPSNLGSLTQSNRINVYVIKGSTKVKIIKFDMPRILNDKSSFTVWDYWTNKDMQFKFNYGSGFTPSISYEQFDITWDSLSAGFKQLIVNEIRFSDVALLEKVLVDEAAKKPQLRLMQLRLVRSRVKAVHVQKMQNVIHQKALFA